MFLTWPVWICSFILVLSLASAASAENSEKVTSPIKSRDVNKTISKVEALLKKNPNLPRLTRGEILSLLDNITKADAEKKKKQQVLNAIMDDKTRTEYERALMVVLPFQANGKVNNSLELQELYTKSPITKIIVEETTTAGIETTTKKKRRRNQSRRKPSIQERPIVIQEEQPILDQHPVYVHKSRRKSTTTTTTTPRPTTTTESNWKPYTGMELRQPQPFGYHNDVIKNQNENPDIGVPDRMKQTLVDIGIPKNHKPETIFVTPPQTPSTAKPVTTTTTAKPFVNHIPDISLAVQSLTPEMRNLLISFGLVNPDGTPTSEKTAKSTTPPPLSVFEYKPISPTVDPSSYINFKPLPNSREAQKGYDDMNSEMKTFLASYGLMPDTPNSFRSQKALNNSSDATESPKKIETTTKFSISNINTDILNDDMKNVLENLGLMKTSRRQSKGHIFNPAAHSAGLLQQSDETEKINKLLGTIKQLKEAEKNNTLSDEEIAAKFENITASLNSELSNSSEESTEMVQTDGTELSYEGYEPADEELLKLQNGIFDEDLEGNGVYNVGNDITSQGDSSVKSEDEKQNSSKTLQQTLNAPDPLSLEELTQFHQSYKNEVKRQQPKTSSAESSTSTSSADTTTESSTDETTSTTEATTTSARDSSPSLTDLEDSFGGSNPTSKPNGLYFLVDWNTFLRVGTDNRTVDLNFAPKVGDPKNFLPINVP